MNHRDPLKASFISLRARSMMRAFGTSVSPLFIDDERRNVQFIGSGVLLSLSGAFGIVTAKHVIHNSKNTLIWAATGGRFVALKGCRIKAFADESLDIAIIDFTPAVTAQFAQSRFLDHTEICGDNYQAENSNYVALGFFQNTSRTNATNRRHEIKGAAFTLIEPRKQKIISGISKSKHLILDFDRKDFYSGMRKLIPPKIDGFSGSPIFCFGPVAASGVAHAKLVAILIEYRKAHKCVIGTKLQWFLDWETNGFGKRP